jgi:DNA-binding HxlR family transcriptional regulator
MGRTADYSKEVCSVAGALSVVGDPWTLLILRDAFSNIRRFDDWQARLGVARNVLAARLKSLVAHGVMETRLYSERPPRREYVLTPKGRDLLPVLLTLKDWGDKHIYAEAGAPARFTHKCGEELTPRIVCDACGETVKSGDLRAAGRAAGPTVGELLPSLSEA